MGDSPAALSPGRGPGPAVPVAPVPRQVHPPRQRRAGLEPVEQVAGAGGRPADLVPVDRVDERFPGRAAVPRRDAPPALLAIDRRAGSVLADAGCHGQHVVAAADGVEASPAALLSPRPRLRRRGKGYPGSSPTAGSV
ncbi:hypothetical protein GCM10011594_09500 [Nakamurella endophytica]|uniref:Uncharacterized protein n=1 Tax=Nakamurella endophytica TaxID=1748367 RepID=A0A917SQ00_9ACTN|nr:hypothetical protein GCM10011594_09500 [Nakamurella endophytica]